MLFHRSVSSEQFGSVSMWTTCCCRFRSSNAPPSSLFSNLYCVTWEKSVRSHFNETLRRWRRLEALHSLRWCHCLESMLVLCLKVTWYQRIWKTPQVTFRKQCQLTISLIPHVGTASQRRIFSDTQSSLLSLVQTLVCEEEGRRTTATRVRKGWGRGLWWQRWKVNMFVV